MPCGCEAVSRALAGVREARRLLLCPTAGSLQECAAHIESAVQSVREFKPVPGAAAELADLRKEAALATALLEGAAAFQLGWARLLFTAACGYTARGEPAPPGPLRTVSVKG
jgi:hypothetical protein